MSTKLPKNNVLSSVSTRSLTVNYMGSHLGGTSEVQLCASTPDTVGDIGIATLTWSSWGPEVLDAAKALKEAIEREVVQVLTADDGVAGSGPGDVYGDEDDGGWHGPDEDDYNSDPGITFGA